MIAPEAIIDGWGSVDERTLRGFLAPPMMNIRAGFSSIIARRALRGRRGFSSAPTFASYTENGVLRFNLTNSNNSSPLYSLLGPGFRLADTAPPVVSMQHSLGAEKVLELVEEAYQDGSKAPIDIVFDNMVGEPTLEMNTLVEAGRLIKERRHGVPLTVNTNGLLGSAGAEQLFDMDVRQS